MSNPIRDLYEIQRELGNDNIQPEDLYAAAEIHDSLMSGSFYEQQAQAMQDIWGSVDRITARAANKERIQKGLEPIAWTDSLAHICPMIQFVVVDEHTLGVINPKSPDVIQKLSHSVLLGATFGSEYDSIHKPWTHHTIRPAKIADFDTFRVSKTGYENDSRYDFPIQ